MAYAKAKYNFSKEEKSGIFEQYDSKWVQFLVNLLPSYSTSRILLEREYGKNLDGIGAERGLSYRNRQRLQGVIGILEERLKCIEILMNRGEDTKKIEKRFIGKSSEQIDKMVKDILVEGKEKPIFLFQNKNEILRKYNIREDTLNDAIEQLENGEDRILYKYTYKIGTTGMSKSELLDFLKLSEQEYRNRLLKIQESLPILLEKAKENEQEFDSYEKQMNHKEKKQRRESRNDSKKNFEFLGTYFKDNFLDVPYTDFYFNQVISYRRSVAPKAFSLLTILYGNQLEEEQNSKDINSSQVFIIKKEIAQIKSILEAKKIVNGLYLPETFLALFQTEENKDILTKERVLGSKKENSSVYQILQTIYGSDFSERKKEVSLTNSQMIAIRKFVYSAIKAIKREETFPFADDFKEHFDMDGVSEEIWKTCLEEQANKAKKTYSRLETIYGVGLKDKAMKRKIPITYFNEIRVFIGSLARRLEKAKIRKIEDVYFMDTFTKNVDFKKAEIISKKVKAILFHHQRMAGYSVGQLLFGMHFDEPKKKIALTTAQQSSYNYFVQNIKKVLLEQKNIIDYLYSSEEKSEENIKQFYTILKMYQEEYKESSELMALFDEDGYALVAHFSPKQREQLAFLKKYVSQRMAKDRFEGDENLPRRNRGKRALTFMEYFVLDTISISNKEEIKNRIHYFIKTYIPVQHDGYQIAQKLYGVDLEEEKKKITLTEKQKNDFKNFVFMIRKYLQKGVVEKRRPIHFIDEFTTYNTSQEERAFIEKEVPLILESLSKDSQYYQAGEKLYGPKLQGECVQEKFPMALLSSFSYLVRTVKERLNKKKEKLQCKDSKQESCMETSDFSIQTLLKNEGEFIADVLQKEPFKTFMSTVTKIEQELIYLKLVQKRNPNLTDEIISSILNLPLEDIHSYEIMIKDDELNSFNKYIKKGKRI